MDYQFQLPKKVGRPRKQSIDTFLINKPLWFLKAYEKIILFKLFIVRSKMLFYLLCGWPKKFKVSVHETTKSTEL